MNRLTLLAKRGLIALIVTLMAVVLPSPAFAEGQSTTSGSSGAATTTGTTAPVAAPANGVTKPTGSAAGTYHFNDKTGLWENDYYTYNPATQATTPKQPLEYTYNPSTGLWDTLVWQYVASDAKYIQVTVSVTAPPDGAITHGSPPPPADTSTSASSGNEANSPQTTTDNSSAGTGQPTTAASGAGSTTGQQDVPTSAQAAINGTGSGSTNTIKQASGNSGGTTLTFNTAGTITNLIASTAQSGNVGVGSNTTVGNAQSGNATTIANVLNLLQSQTGFGGAAPATFTATIQGDVQGDFLIDPATMIQPAGSVDPTGTNLKINSNNNGSIVNNINLDANSGTASANMNTSAGNVSSGNANAIADVVNMINSVVAANQSFVGVINIEGNYTGNILMPEGTLNALLGSSGSDPAGGNGSTQTNITSNTTQNIDNNVNLAAASGTASANENTEVGNVASGNAMTNLTILNLTGKNVIAANSLLVFVNVLGSWVGLIMDAPAGSTSAALGGGVTTNTTMPTAQTAISTNDNASITNNITARAGSGNATASRNTTVGDVTTGDATASANIANVIGSNFSLSNWFGVLFINVLGVWKGNFGVAKPPVVPPITSGSATAAGTSGGSNPVNIAKVFQFVPAPGGNGSTGSGSTASGSGDSDMTLSPLSQANASAAMSSAEMVSQVGKALGAFTTKNGGGAGAKQATLSSGSDQGNTLVSVAALGLGVVGLLYVSFDRIRSSRRKAATATKG